MPLQLPEPPAEVPEKVKGRLHAFADGGKFSTKALKSARKEQLALTTPHEVFTMGLDDLAAGAGLDRAESVGWRYLVSDGNQVIASAETAPAADGSQEVSQFTEGPFVLGTDKAVKVVRKLPQLEKKGYELRLLRIPALYVMALWLHSPSDDLLVPLEPSPIGKEGKPVPTGDFLAELGELARNTVTPPA
ncbi:hypothetical protein LTV02_10850 [Nocardia yamanashiensis]|uniref:hypothetical protein n=1 Tax=Nocardia yamanashiensis TaxID=209247 RepID=UPI001E579BA9|nr:hypothetical protein [Nocardia yamanashiensis]UGT43846.1 hypothetical protein LTV02_10850 [Nocardia yamanashiensis]